MFSFAKVKILKDNLTSILAEIGLRVYKAKMVRTAFQLQVSASDLTVDLGWLCYNNFRDYREQWSFKTSEAIVFSSPSENSFHS